MDANDEQRLRIGELARRTGLTVRALHHYDEIGLLEPGERTFAGHRLYRPDDVARLFRILALKRLGVPLAEIGAIVDGNGDGADPRRAVRDHLARLGEEIRLQGELRERLVRILDVLDRLGEAPVNDYIEAIERMTMIEQHYTPEQLAYLAERREELGTEAIEAVENEWPQLIAAVEAEIERGAEPSDPKVQDLAARWRELVAMFHGGNEGVRDSLKQMWTETSPEEMRARVETMAGPEAAAGIPDPEVSAFIARANEVAGESF